MIRPLCAQRLKQLPSLTACVLRARKPQLTRKSGAAYAPGTWCLLSKARRALSAAAYAGLPLVALEVIIFALRSLLSFFTLAFFALLMLLLREE